jgi:hypothetical protein
MKRKIKLAIFIMFNYKKYKEIKKKNDFIY